VLGTIKDVVDELRAKGEKIGVLGITSFRPFPLKAVRDAIGNAKRLVVPGEGFSVGIGGIVARRADGDVGPPAARTTPWSPAWAGGHHQGLAARMLDEAVADSLEPLTFLDLDWGLVERELEREPPAPLGPDRREHAARPRCRARSAPPDGA
jgi:pyruvate ferredoxin oxidoreductase alpha subunit